MDDPISFGEDVLGFKPYSYQKEFIQGCQTHDRVVGLFARQSGKTECMSVFTIWYSIMHDGKSVLIFSPTQDQSDIMFKRIHMKFLFNSFLKRFVDRATASEIVLNNGSVIKALTVGNYGDTKRGYTGDLIIEEEASLIKDSIDSQVIMPMLASRPKAKLIKIGTPKTKGHFYRSAYGPKSTYKLYAFDWTYPDKEGLYQPGFIDEYRNTHSEADFRVEYGIEFIEDSDNYFRETDVLGCILPHPTGRYDEGKRYFVGVDVARYGMDDTAIVIVEEAIHDLHPHRVIHVESYNGKPITWTIGRIRELHDHFKFSKIVVDENGMGAGPVDLLKELGAPVEGFTFTGQSKVDLYSNLTVLLEKRKLTIPNDRKLIGQMLDLKKEVTTLHTKIHHPDGGHDDMVDGLCLAVWPLRVGRKATFHIA